MKLRYVIAPVVAATLVACSPPADGPSGGERAARDSGWVAPPRVEAVARASSGDLLITGTAAPGTRVVLRGLDGSAFAAGADGDGRFEVRMAAPVEAVILTPEVQTGQVATPASEQLLLPAGGAGVTAMLAAGRASRRLDAAPALDAVDGDGRGLIVSGRGGPGQAVSVGLVGGDTITARADGQGRWIAVLPRAADQAAAIRVGTAVFAYPGPGAVPAEGQALIERASQGVRVMRALSPTARQSSWFPEAASTASSVSE